MNSVAAGALFQMDFEDSSELEIIRVVGSALWTELSRNESFSHYGQSSLQLTVTDPGGGEQLRPAIDIELSEAMASSDIKAISCWVHVPPALAGHFFGRYDARILLNGNKPHWSIPAIKPGWTHLRWEFSNLYQHPRVETIRLQFGPILPGFGEGEIHFDGFTIEAMEAIEYTGAADLIEVVGDAKRPWADRFQAIRKLNTAPSLQALPALFIAVADGMPEEGYNAKSADMQTAYIDKPPVGSQAVRSAAMAAIGDLVAQVATDALPRLRRDLDESLASADGRIRLATVEALRSLESDSWTRERQERALLDDIFYIRDVAQKGLASSGQSSATVAKGLATVLLEGHLPNQKAAARRLSEMGAPAVSALPALQMVLRDAKADQRLRLWCLRAVWWTDESVLLPEDWVLGLELKPGEIHRHLLNRTMDRLQLAGEQAIPALESVLASSNPEARARAATLLSKIGPAADEALSTARVDPMWYVRDAAGTKTAPLASTDGPVRVESSGNRVLFSNGLVEMEFDLEGQDPGPFSARLGAGENMIESDWLYDVLSFKNTPAQSIIERVWFQKIHGVPLNKELEWEFGSADDDQAEMICRYPGTEDFPLEWEFHYVLRRGDSGFYRYMIVRNITGEELPESTITHGANAIGMIRQLVAPTWGLFNTAILHDNFKWPVSFADNTDRSLYPDIYQATFRMPDGGVDAKHEGWNYELNSPVMGYTGKAGGFWQIIPSLEFSGASWPWNQRTGLSHNLFITALEDKYYIPVGVRIRRDWEKIYGPMFFYMNTGENSEEMWMDAKRRAASHVEAWPYQWIDYDGFHERGRVEGKVNVPEGNSPEGAWALLALPGGDIPESVEFGEWWRDVGPYHYVATVEEDGSFDIENVRSGDYDLFIWHGGMYGEYQRAGLAVTAGETLEVGDCLLESRDRGHLLWQIGEPNRTMTEFKNGGNFHQWDNYMRYREDFPDDMDFVVGQSDPKKDWNYLQPAIVRGESKPTSAVIRFEFDPSVSGNPVLTVVAGGRGVNMEILVNGQTLGDLKIANIGLQHIRSVPYGELTVHRYGFDRSVLRSGSNQVTLRFVGRGGVTEEDKQWSYEKWTSYIAYDFLRMELVP